jgi:hypothetical protein
MRLRDIKKLEKEYDGSTKRTDDWYMKKVNGENEEEELKKIELHIQEQIATQVLSTFLLIFLILIINRILLIINRILLLIDFISKFKSYLLNHIFNVMYIR